jgi:membrane protease YdiL (CAAX protease family)
VETLEKQSPLARFFFSVLAVWVVAWLPLGLWKGDLDYVLSAVSRQSVERQVYQGLLYCGLLLVFLDSWGRHAPLRPGPGRLIDLLRYAGLGLTSALVLRVVMFAAGARPIPSLEPSLVTVLIALVSALTVAVVEEAVFRGFLLGCLAQSMKPASAIVISSVLFATVHLFRPGPISFKAGYALGLFLLAVLLARVAWAKGSVAAAAGLHAGVIFPNLLDPWVGLAPYWWSGWQQEPASGALGWLLTLGLWAQWEWWQARRPPSGTERDNSAAIDSNSNQ